MVDNIRISKKQMAILFSGVLVAAFLGITAGSYLVQQKPAKASKLGTNFMLKSGQNFPEFKFSDLDGGMFDLGPKLQGKKSILILLTADCPHCVQVVKRWDSAYASIGPEYQVMGISYEKIERLKEFRDANKIPFPLYNDAMGKFTGKYKVDAYPTIIGVGENKRIAFVEFGNRPKKTVGDYLKMF